MTLDLFVKKLEQLDYNIKRENNNIILLILEKMKLELINEYTLKNNCNHNEYIDEGYFKFENNKLEYTSEDNAKYHILSCNKCNCKLCLVKQNNLWNNEIDKELNIISKQKCKKL